MRATSGSPLELEKRHKIFDTLSRAPGLHFRELQRRTGYAMGELQYHLDYLEKHSLVKRQKSGKFVYYYALKVVRKENEEKILPLLRQKRIRQMLLALLEKPLRQTDLAMQTGLSPGAVSVYVNRLADAGVIEKTLEGAYVVRNPTALVEILIGYKDSFLDPLLDRFIEAWLPLGKNQ